MTTILNHDIYHKLYKNIYTFIHIDRYKYKHLYIQLRSSIGQSIRHAFERESLCYLEKNVLGNCRYDLFCRTVSKWINWIPYIQTCIYACVQVAEHIKYQIDCFVGAPLFFRMLCHVFHTYQHF